MEGNVKWHHSVPNNEEYEKAKIELNFNENQQGSN